MDLVLHGCSLLIFGFCYGLRLIIILTATLGENMSNININRNIIKALCALLECD